MFQMPKLFKRRIMHFFHYTYYMKTVPKLLCFGIVAVFIILIAWNVSERDIDIDFKQNHGRRKLRFRPSLFEGTEVNGNAGVEVMISAYMRSGSTFLGKVLGHRSDTFYMYEPLWGLSRYSYYAWNATKCVIFNQMCYETGELQIAFRVLFQIYGCNFNTDPMLRFFKPNIHAKLSGKRWNVFKECSAKNHTLDTCLRYMSSNVCSRSQNKVTKVLRISLFNLKSFLEVRPNLKIVHLFRDPRAVINSHIRTNWSPVRANSLESVASVSRSICGRMADDIENAKKLKAEFPQRFLIVQYEDFKNPLPKIRKLIDFVGMKFTSEAYNFIDIDTNATSGSKLNGNHPFLYREQLEWRFVRVINRYCSNIYKELGYTMFGSEEELKDTEIQPVTSPLPYALL